MKIALDTNCFIDAVHPASSSCAAMQEILVAQSTGQVEIFVSLHTMHELERRPDNALDLARRFETLPYCPIGKINELLGTIKQLTGTFDDLRRNHILQQNIGTLAKAGNDLHDRGAVIDALHASMDLFVTSDTQLVGAGPAKRIFDKVHIRIVCPDEAARVIKEASVLNGGGNP